MSTVSSMFERIPDIVKSYVDAAVPRPLQMLEPAQGQGGQLLLANRPENSSDSGAATRRSASAPETSGVSPGPSPMTGQ